MTIPKYKLTYNDGVEYFHERINADARILELMRAKSHYILYVSRDGIYQPCE